MTPRQLGYRMPAEWEPHEATWLAWPHETTDWPGKFAAIPWVYGEIVRRLARVERVRILVNDPHTERRARRVLQKCGANLEAVEFFRIRTDRSWTRDFGPIFVKNAQGRTAILNWHFNGWAKYDNWKHDDAATGKLALILKFRGRTPFVPLQRDQGRRRFAPTLWVPEYPPGQGRRVVLEGGSIDVNGCGTLLTTEECLLSREQTRNPGLSRDDLHTIFREYLRITHVVWLRRGIAGDDTHGHVDDLVRFVNPTTVVTVVEHDPSDVNYAPLQENLALLRKAKDQDGHRLRVETLPMPRPMFFDGQRLPASYANFYVANKLVLVPTFNDPNDRLALNTLATLFPDREVVPIACVDLVLGLGTLHCMTQQQPA